MFKSLYSVYKTIVFNKPYLGILLILVLSLLAATQLNKFRLDASADSLILESDEDLKYFREVSRRYPGGDFLFVAYKPDESILSGSVLKRVSDMQAELEEIDGVDSMLTVLNVPLIDSPRVSFTEISEGVRTLRSLGVDESLALKEFKTSPLYKNLLMSPDGKTMAMQLNLKVDEALKAVAIERDALREKKWSNTITAEETLNLTAVEQKYTELSTVNQGEQKALIKQIREVMANYQGHGEMYLGGISMIASDMTDFVSRDIKVFGIAILLFLIATLAFIFRQVRWVVLPMLCCFVSVFVVIGLVGLLGWPITVISSNFTSLLLIMTMSLTIHLMVRYRELNQLNPEWDQKALVGETVKQMAKPCFYTAITTIVAFTSLVFSGIRPVIDFGYIMVVGICVAFCLSFILFPALASLLQAKPKADSQKITNAISAAIAGFTQRFSTPILVGSLIIAILSVVGITKLEVENRFIDYFKSDTEIYKGMYLIDRDLGGTTPLDIVIKADSKFTEAMSQAPEALTEDDELDSIFGDDDPDVSQETAAVEAEEDDFDLLADDYAEEESANSNLSAPTYWFNQNALARLEAVHDYVEAMPQIGKVLSMTTGIRMVETINDGNELNDIELAVLRAKLPAAIKEPLFDPYVSEDGNEVRISMRVIDSDPSLRRNELIKKLNVDLKEKFGFEEGQYRLTNMVVLYNNMLQSLFKSQMMTLGAVMLAILFMFVILFRSLSLSLVAIIPNIFAAAFVIGLMGWIGLPLDLMSITIAAIAVGIGVDNAIHYIVRYREEYAKDQDYEASVFRSHGTIGKGIYFTNLTVIAGFSILILSSFTPTIYFGLLTALAMFAALLANLILLPRLLVVFKPLGK